jgi:hypothetical protein
MGYILFFAGCPLIWKSQLIQEICLSATQSEYHSLSIAIRALIPVFYTLREMVRELGLPEEIQATVQCRCLEDNSACLQLMTEQRLTQRTRYYNSKFHWAWTHIGKNSESGLNLIIEKIDTKLQRADGFTKGNVREVFERLRKLTCGW